MTPAHHDDNGAELQPTEQKNAVKVWSIWAVVPAVALWAAIFAAWWLL